MTPPAADQRDDSDGRQIELPTTAASQRALHESIGHLYDELAISRENGECGTPTDEVFDQLESLYVATAEESVSSVELTYELEG